MSEGVRQIAPVTSLLTTKQVAERWGVNPGTVRNWISGGRIPGTTESLPFMKLGRQIRFSLHQVEYIESRWVRVNTRSKRRRTTPRSGAA